jgi:hypothetical protein
MPTVKLTELGSSLASGAWPVESVVRVLKGV